MARGTVLSVGLKPTIIVQRQKKTVWRHPGQWIMEVDRYLPPRIDEAT